MRKPAPQVIIGFDVEWFTDPAAPEHNIILSYQYAGRTDSAEWSGIVYTRAAQKLKYPYRPGEDLKKVPIRYSFQALIGHAIAAGVKLKKLRKWPKQVIATAHWTRADLAAMTDFPKFKHTFAGVHKTYVSLNGKGYKASFTNNGHTHEFNISLVDTMLLAPGGDRTLKALAPLYDEQKLDPGVAPDGARYIEPWTGSSSITPNSSRPTRSRMPRSVPSTLRR